MDIHTDRALVTTLVLEKLRLGMGVEICESMAQSLTLESTVGYLADTLRFRLTAYVLSHTYADKSRKVYFHVPINWWEHFKRDVLKRKNIKSKALTKIVRFRQIKTYPYALEQRLGKSFEFQILTEAAE